MKYESIIRSDIYWKNTDVVSAEYIVELYNKVKKTDERIYSTTVLLEDTIIELRKLEALVASVQPALKDEIMTSHTHASPGIIRRGFRKIMRALKR